MIGSLILQCADVSLEDANVLPFLFAAMQHRHNMSTLTTLQVQSNLHKVHNLGQGKKKFEPPVTTVLLVWVLDMMTRETMMNHQASMAFDRLEAQAMFTQLGQPCNKPKRCKLGRPTWSGHGKSRCTLTNRCRCINKHGSNETTTAQNAVQVAPSPVPTKNQRTLKVSVPNASCSLSLPRPSRVFKHEAWILKGHARVHHICETPAHSQRAASSNCRLPRVYVECHGGAPRFLPRGANCIISRGAR
mmetsp:Transcript_31948/g.61480  ORF Transcript_31948/g.61480 Transcript_31948/m.61480 type:complete len:246 (+) Transcript_31948:121-858(+)